MKGDNARAGKQTLRCSKSRNHLLQRPKLGKPAKPISKEALSLTHGMKNAKGDTAGDLFVSWPAVQPNERSVRTPIGKKTRKFFVAGANELTHGMSTVPREPGAKFDMNEAMAGWHAGWVEGECEGKKKGPAPDIMFGRATSREMGVSDLIGHQYGRISIESISSRPASSASRATTSQSQSRSEYNHGGEFPSRPPTGASSRPGSSRPTSTRAAPSRSKAYRDVQEE